MQTENLKSFFVWYVITCHLITYRASRNRFSVISFRDYLRYFGIFLAHYFMKIDRFIFKSSHSFLTLRASWLVWCLYRYYRRNKSRCRFKRDVTIEYLTRTTLETQLTVFWTWSVLSSFSAECVYFVDKYGFFWWNLYRHHTKQLARKVRRLYEGLKLYYNRFSSRNAQGIFQNSASNRESWSWKSDCVTLGELEDDMLSHTRRKNSLDSQSQFWTHSAVCSGLIRYFRSFPR